MQWLYELIQWLTAAQQCLGDGSATDTCPAGVLHSITAAMATQGYWVQADLLYFLEYTNFETWAILIYIFAFSGALFSMALGAPPKMWLWLVISPGIFHWLIADTVPLTGVHWNIGPRDNGTFTQESWEGAQREVWKLAEVGLLNTNIAKRGNLTVYADRQPTGGSGIGISGGTANVSQIFSYYDRLLTDLVDWVISWTGLYTLRPSNASGGDSNVPSEELYDVTQKAGGGTIDNSNWLLSNLKWSMLEDVTSAKVQSPDLRDAFATFFGSECGDAFSQGVDEASFVAAHNAKGLTVPDTVFVQGGLLGRDYTRLTGELRSQQIPTPPSLRKFLEKGGAGSFRESIGFLDSSEGLLSSGILDQIRCDQFLYLLTHALRWEAGHIYYQMAARLPGGFNPAALHYSMMYGWAVKKDSGAAAPLSIGSLLRIIGGGAPGAGSGNLNQNEVMRFFQNLVLVHLWRNEMALVPRVNVRKSGSAEAVGFVESYQRTVGAKSKFGEVYSWAMMMPRLQGILLYFFAMAYPFCAMLVLIPGWHKILFTWASFWAWVKIWDIGFAIAFVIERSMWALIGNSPDAQRLFSKVLLMDDTIDSMGSHVTINCSAGSTIFNILGGGTSPLPQGLCAPGDIPTVITSGTMESIGAVTGAASGLGVGGALASFGQFELWQNSLSVMDRAMTIGASMKLDVENSYYIYIMSALYFAVPAVTGQLVLGAKAGAASLATNAIGGSAGESGRAAGSGFSGDLSQRARANQSAIGQAAYAKDMRGQAAAGGFAAKAMDQGNAKMMASAQGAFNQTASSGEGHAIHNTSLAKESAQGALGLGKAIMDSGYDQYSALNQGVNALPGARSSGNQLGGGGRGAAPGASTSSTGATPGASASGGAGGPTGVPAVDAYNTGRNLAQTAGNMGAAWNSGEKARFNGAQAKIIAGLNEANFQQQAAANALQSQAGVNAFGFGQQAAGFDVSSGRNSQAADFQAKSAQYDAERNYASALGGELAAMGAGGAVSIGSKPVGMEPMAMMGQLGRDMQKRAGFAENQFQSFVQSGQAKLQGAYGYAATAGRFQSADGGALMKQLVDGASSMGQLAVPGAGGNLVKRSSEMAFGSNGSVQPLMSPQQGNPAPVTQSPNLSLIGGPK